MSLLNRMLQDLDARQKDGRALVRLPDDVRPLPPAPTSRLPVWLAVTAVTACLAGAGAYYFLWPALVTEPVPPVVPLASNVSPPPPPEPPPPEVPVMEVPPPAPVKAPADAETSPPTPIGGDAGSSLRIADVLAGGEAKKASPKAPLAAPRKEQVAERAASAPEKSDPPAKVRTEEKSGPGKSALAVPSARRAAEDPLIEKNDAAGMARDNGEADYRKAIQSVNQGRIVEALDGLQAALRHDGRHAAARQLMIKLLIEARRGDEAMQVLREGLQLLPQQANWAMALARMQVERKDYSGAWQTLEHSMPAGGASADYQGFAGHVLQRMGRNKEAAAHYLAAARLAPNEGRWWLGLGLSYDAEGMVNESREALQRAKASGTLSAELMAIADQRLR